MATYQNSLLAFWDRASKAHETVSNNFKGYQHYEFNILKATCFTSLSLSLDPFIIVCRREMLIKK